MQDFPIETANIIRDNSLEKLWSWAEPKYHSDPAHNLAHIHRVLHWTLKFNDGSFTPREAFAAALLHDIVNLPKNDPNRKNASQLSADLAAKILPEYSYSLSSINKICAAIRDHSFSAGRTPDSALGKALQDADRLEALGAIGIYRWLITGFRMNAEFYHPEDPWASNRALDDAHYSVDHFFTKLKKLSSTFHNQIAQKEAERRTKIMKDFLLDLSDEIGIPFVDKRSEQ